MSLNIKEFWKQIRNPKSEKVLDVTEWISNSTSATLGLAVALGVVNPTLPLVLAGLAFTSPFRKIADIIIKYRTKNEINLNEIVAIAAPLAYLKSYQYWIENNSILREKLSSIQTSIDEVSNFMNGLILSDDLAGRAIHDFCTSDLAKAFNSILREQLLKHNLDNIEANITVTWVAWKAREYLKEAIKDIRDSRHINIDNLGQVNIYLLADSTVDNNSCDDIQIYLNQQ
ncbi:MAG: hypothetical protein RLZZ135_2455, partial [Cyanobacteriota bacterium]